MKLRCQICFEWIAEVDREKLAYPMRGFMFKSVDPHHGFEAPFPVSATWEHMRCPYGTHRPMIKDDEIQTDEGLINLLGGGTTQWAPVIKRTEPYVITPGPAGEKKFERISTERTVKKREPIKKAVDRQEEKAGEAYACEICGKEFEKEINLKRHILMAHKGV